MQIQTHTRVQAFLDAALPMLTEREAVNNFALGIALGRQHQTEPVKEGSLITIVEENKVVAATVLLRKHLFISLAPGHEQAAALLAQYFEPQHERIESVMIETWAAAAYDAHFSKPVVTRHRLLAHELSSLLPQPKAAGHVEWANAEDQHWVADWIIAFETEALIPRDESREEYEKKAAAMIEKNILLKWMNEGRTVSIAALVRQTPSLGIVGLVYTPPADRGRGYATSCVEHLSRHILSLGLDGCGLFSDVSNPASNHIYQKMGYELRGEVVEMNY